jgi:hypothetical protein
MRPLVEFGMSKEVPFRGSDREECGREKSGQTGLGEKSGQTGLAHLILNPESGSLLILSPYAFRRKTAKLKGSGVPLCCSAGDPSKPPAILTARHLSYILR